jgi:hypothetical protein
MTPAARRVHETLAALGFTRDKERSTRSHAVWIHPADRRQPVKVWSGLKDQTAQLIIRRAEQIAGLAVSETPEPTTKDRQRERRQADAARRVAERIAHERALAPYQRQADQRAAEKAKREALRQRSQLIERWQDAREQLARTQQCGHDTRRAVAAVNEVRQAIDRFDAEHRP